MALLQIYTFPDPVLKQKAEPVTEFNTELKALTESMLETMYDANGIGLAANQVGLLKRVLVIDVHSGSSNPEELRPQVFVNPEIVDRSGETTYEEGCLSVIDFTADVLRFKEIEVQFQTVEGEVKKQRFDGLEAICLQHEMDHLNGILFIDHLPPLKQKMVKKRLLKHAKQRELV